MPGPRLQGLRQALDGPEWLLLALDEAIKDAPAIPAARQLQLRRFAENEIHRMQRALIASFLHPNDDAARQYADVAVERYTSHVALAADARREERPGSTSVPVPGTETRSGMLGRFKLRSAGSQLADIGHLDVDALALIVVTSRMSDAMLVPDIFLDVAWDRKGTPVRHEFQLNFQYRRLPMNIPKKFYPHFEPQATNRFTLPVVVPLRLADIRGFRLRMGPQPGNLIGGTVWRPRRVQLEINGRVVHDVTYRRSPEVRPGGTLDLQYPPPPPRGGTARQRTVAAHERPRAAPPPRLPPVAAESEGGGEPPEGQGRWTRPRGAPVRSTRALRRP